MTSAPTLKDPLALIIEDNEAVAHVFQVAIEQAQFEIELIQNGRIALDRLAVVTPALILLDLHLPHVSGQEILRYVRADERLAKTPVILATADVTKAETLKGEVDFVLIKPFGFVQLHELAKRLRLSLSK
jgi:DNA-binding response OmpR family regulator